MQAIVALWCGVQVRLDPWGTLLLKSTCLFIWRLSSFAEARLNWSENIFGCGGGEAIAYLVPGRVGWHSSKFLCGAYEASECMEVRQCRPLVNNTIKHIGAT